MHTSGNSIQWFMGMTNFDGYLPDYLPCDHICEYIFYIFSLIFLSCLYN